MRFLAPVLALAVFSAPAFAGDPASKTETKEEDSAKTNEPKKICRYVHTDMSSRRKERVCLTKEQWREQNNSR